MKQAQVGSTPQLLVREGDQLPKKGKKTFTVKLNKAGKKLKKQGKKVPVTVEVTYKAAK